MSQEQEVTPPLSAAKGDHFSQIINIVAAAVGIVGVSLAYFAFRQERAILVVSAYSYAAMPGAMLEGLHRATHFVNSDEHDREQLQDWIVLSIVNEGKRAARVESVTAIFRQTDGPGLISMKMPVDIELNEGHRSSLIAIAPARLKPPNYGLGELAVVDDAGVSHRLAATSIRRASPSI